MGSDPNCVFVCTCPDELDVTDWDKVYSENHCTDDSTCDCDACLEAREDEKDREFEERCARAGI